MFGYIMVPFDTSEPAMKALKFALDLAGNYGSKISVVSYVPMNTDYSSDDASYVETTKVQKQSAMNSLSKLEPGLQKAGVPFELKVVEGISITESLLSYAELHNVDLIVMGSRGLGGFKKLLLGSVASGISQHSKCPVLIVK